MWFCSFFYQIYTTIDKIVFLDYTLALNLIAWQKDQARLEP